VKWVIAVGGQTVSCGDLRNRNRNRIVVNGMPIDEPYVYYSVKAGPATQAPLPKITVPHAMM